MCQVLELNLKLQCLTIATAVVLLILGQKERKKYEVVREPEDLFFFDCTTSALTEQGYEMLVNAYTDYALPRSQQIVAVLAQELEPEKYPISDFFNLGRGEEKKEKES